MTENKRPLGEPIPETWYILMAAPTRDAALAAWLNKIGVVEVWRPTEQAWKPCRGARRKVPYERAIAPGYVFCLFDREPIWHILWEQAGKRARGVVGVHERPYAVPERVMAQMQMVPARIDVLRAAEEAKRREERLARQPMPGAPAMPLTGAMAGRVVDVSSIHAGVARFILNGIEFTTPVEHLERVAPAAE